MKVNIQTNLKRLCADSTGGTRAEDKDINQSRELRSYKPSEMSKACANENQLTTRKKNTNPVHPFCKEKGQSKIVHETTPSCAQNLDKEKTFDQKDSVSQSRYGLMITGLIYSISIYFVCHAVKHCGYRND